MNSIYEICEFYLWNLWILFMKSVNTYMLKSKFNYIHPFRKMRFNMKFLVNYLSVPFMKVFIDLKVQVIQIKILQCYSRIFAQYNFALHNFALHNWIKATLHCTIQKVYKQFNPNNILNFPKWKKFLYFIRICTRLSLLTAL